jgi:hypothetical protein
LELRVYPVAGSPDVFPLGGIDSLLVANNVSGLDASSLICLIPWDSLAQREQAWTRFHASPEWLRERDHFAGASRIAIYRATA